MTSILKKARRFDLVFKQRFEQLDWSVMDHFEVGQEELTYCTTPEVSISIQSWILHTLQVRNPSLARINLWHLYNAPGMDTVSCILSSTLPEFDHLSLHITTVSLSPQYRLDAERNNVNRALSILPEHKRVKVRLIQSNSDDNDIHMSAENFTVLSNLRTPHAVYVDPPWMRSNGNTANYTANYTANHTDPHTGEYYSASEHARTVQDTIKNTLDYMRKKQDSTDPIFVFKLPCDEIEMYHALSRVDLQGYRVQSREEGFKTKIYFYMFTRVQ
jgi:hypothetical protein